MNAATKPMKLDAAQQKRLLRLYQQGEPVSELTCMFGISRRTLFRTLKVLKLWGHKAPLCANWMGCSMSGYGLPP